MKKKFLSLMMAAAVVATTSVSAFAANVTGSDANEAQSNVTITGNVRDNKGNDAAGTFKVTVPATANFTVTKTGTFLGTELKVENEGTQDIEVYAYKFIDKNVGEKIEVIKESDVTREQASVPSSKVSMKLTNGSKIAYLKSDNVKGVYKDGEFAQPADESGIELLTLSSGSEGNPTKGTISLEGTAGGQVAAEPVSDEFILTLKIKKAQKQ